MNYQNIKVIFLSILFYTCFRFWYIKWKNKKQKQKPFSDIHTVSERLTSVNSLHARWFDTETFHIHWRILKYVCPSLILLYFDFDWIFLTSVEVLIFCKKKFTNLFVLCNEFVWMKYPNAVFKAWIVLSVLYWGCVALCNNGNRKLIRRYMY